MVRAFLGTPRLAIAVFLALALTGPAAAAADDPNTVLISNSRVGVTRAEYEAELLKLPADIRAGFPNNPKRITDLLQRMLTQKTLAANARDTGLDREPASVLRIRLETDRILSQIVLENVEAKAGAEFDANRARFETRAREMFIVDKARYSTPEQVNATHILFDTTKHTSDEAKALALDARAKIVAGADMAKLARDVSEDPSSGTNSGSLGWFAQKDMDPAFGAAAFALQKVGDVSQPVKSTYGWHIIRLDGRRPPATPTFDQVKDTIMADLRKKYVDEKREDAINAIVRDPKTTLNRAAVDDLVPKVDVEEVKRRLNATSQGGVAAPPAR